MIGLGTEWSRPVQWASTQDEAAWAPVIQDAAGAWAQLELISVSAGLRDAALIFIPAEDVPRLTLLAARQGLGSAVVEAGGQSRVLVARPRLQETVVAYHSGDDDALGDALGYPECCRDHFRATWAAGRDVVTGAEGPWFANTLLRGIGVRLVPWLPCAPDCAETVERAEAFLGAGLNTGLDMAPVESLLRLPLRWDALHGAAIITTPHFRVLMGCPASPERVVYERTGVSWLPTPPPWKDNGFSTPEAMEQAHAAVANQVGTVFSALDLGCGDGALLARLRGAVCARSADFVGVEADPGRAARGILRNGGWVRVLEGRIEEGSGEVIRETPFDVALIMPGRLIEMVPEAAESTRDFLLRPARRLVVYTYDGVDLPALCYKAGLQVRGPVTVSGSTQVAEGVVI